jgi:hypothetical protein
MNDSNIQHCTFAFLYFLAFSFFAPPKNRKPEMGLFFKGWENRLPKSGFPSLWKTCRFSHVRKWARFSKAGFQRIFTKPKSAPSEGASLPDTVFAPATPPPPWNITLQTRARSSRIPASLSLKGVGVQQQKFQGIH